MQCTSINNVVVHTIFSGCVSGIGSYGASDNNMYIFFLFFHDILYYYS